MKLSELKSKLPNHDYLQFDWHDHFPAFVKLLEVCKSFSDEKGDPSYVKDCDCGYNQLKRAISEVERV